MPDAITGLWAAATTPTDTAGAIDHAALARHAQRLLRVGMRRAGAVRQLRRRPVVLHRRAPCRRRGGAARRRRAGAAGHRHRLSRDRRHGGADQGQCSDLGITRTLLLPPYYFAGVSPEGIEDAFAAVLDGVADARLSACLYHIPQVCGVPVPARGARPAARALRRDGVRREGQQRRLRIVPGVPRRGTGCRIAGRRRGADRRARSPPAARARSAAWRTWCRRWCAACSTMPGAQPAIEQACEPIDGIPTAEGGIGGDDRRADLAQCAPAAARRRCGDRRAHRRDAGNAGASRA